MNDYIVVYEYDTLGFNSLFESETLSECILYIASHRRIFESDDRMILQYQESNDDRNVTLCIFHEQELKPIVKEYLCHNF